MANSLRDQFLKMGLADKKQVSQVKKATYKTNKAQDKGRIQTPDENKIHAQQALAQKKEQARIANQKLQEEARQNETIAQIRQLIATNRLSLKDGAIAYHFTDNNRITRIFLPTKEMVDELSQGQLAIIREKDSYAVVPALVAEKIRGWQPDLIVLHNTSSQKPAVGIDDSDDPYAAYQIPDDLIW
jgi:uncharacterized protein YaiL (DUF2058 family)